LKEWGVNGRMILKCILKKYDRRTCTALIYLTIRASGGLFSQESNASGSKFFFQAEKVLSFRKELCGKKLNSKSVV
jgi:hypothetical protein